MTTYPTDYLAAALTKILIETGGGCDIAELQAQLPAYYDAPEDPSDAEIERELDALIAADSVYCVNDGGTVFYYDNSD